MNQVYPTVRYLILCEDVRTYPLEDRVGRPARKGESPFWEVVLHADALPDSDYILDGFRAYLRSLDVSVDLDSRIHVQGLCFIPVRIPAAQIEAVTQFSFLRVARGMPRMRPVTRMAKSLPSFPVALPDADVLDPTIRVAAFDGGLPAVPDRRSDSPYSGIDLTPPLAHPNGMRVPRFRVSAALLIAGLLVLLGAACSSSNGDDIKVRVVTPASRASPPVYAPAGTATPFATPEILLSANSVYQAGTVLVSVTGPVASGSATFLKRTYTLTKGTQSMYAFVGVDADDLPGQYPLTVSYVLPNGSKGTLPGEPVTVIKTNWTVDSVVVGPSLAPLLDPGVGEAELAQITAIYRQYTPEKYWTLGWIKPVEGSITTRFGEQRSYNGSPPAGHHGGTDIGADTGTPIAAANNGRVVLARQLSLRGNMVIIDHGGGLFTGYGHMSSFAVAEGQVVQQGDIIGYVGTTGLSTGPHLHWEMVTNGVFVDALRFVDGTNGF